MEQKLLQELRILKWYAAGLTLVVLFLLSNLFLKKDKHLAVGELDVERINIVENDGAVKMVISNKQRQHPGMLNGKTLQPRERDAGIIFFNSSGDECGGLVYDGSAKEASLTFSVDQFRNDQLMQLQYLQNTLGDSIKRHYGLKLWDRAESFTLSQQVALVDSLKRLGNESIMNEKIQQLKDKGLLGVERMFAGKTDENEVGLFIRDSKGRIRIKIFCDDKNQPRIVMFNEDGSELKNR
ncbi:MAG TPA: hypothetical protein VIM65_18705 [Cyclobacteriaceae bacterium]